MSRPTREQVARIREALECVTVDALVTNAHADQLAKELAQALFPEPSTGDAEAEARRRHPDPTDVETGEPVDDWGYEETARQAFIAGAAWQAQQPRETVTTAAELDALPVGSVVEDPFAAIGVRVATGMEPFDWRRVTTAVKGGEHRHRPYLPATVLHRPEETP